MTTISLFKRHLPVLTSVFFIYHANSQSLYPPKNLSPNVANLGTFGDVPVNLFTGTPNISIPLHTVSYGNINVPINLRYHPSSVKPGLQPGWVGSGWDLESIGTITRQVRGSLDEFYIDATTGTAGPTPPTVTFYHNFPGETVHEGAYYANLPNWNTTTQLNADYGIPSPSPIGNTGDIEADEFSFNIGGHSGKFYYEGAALGWQVVSDEHITVQMTDYFTSADIKNAIQQYVNNFTPASSSLQIWPDQSRSFGSFTLTMPDGTKYVFGGRTGTGVPDGVEFSSPILPTNPLGGSQDQTFTANTWLLTSITDIYGNTVTFNYVRKFPTCDRVLFASAYSLRVDNGTGLVCSAGPCSNPMTDTDFKNKLAGSFQWPMYLSSITTPNEHVNFFMSTQSWNRYTQAMLSYADQANQTSLSIDVSLLGIGNWPASLNNLQWEQLNKIVITDNRINTSFPYPNTIKQYQFNFLNTSSSENQRLMLGSLQVLDNQNNLVGQYSFNYYSDLSSINIGNTGSKIYATGNYSDHWGFYNATDITVSPVNIYNGKQPNPNVVTTELLTQITYPTGGHTSFSWQPSDYSQVVDPARQQLNGQVGYGGGSRIYEIQNVLADGTIASDKKYYYKNGYMPGANLNSLSSSGVLNGTPQYYFATERSGFGGGLVYWTVTSLYGTGNYGYTGQGSPIGYKEVDEVNLDGSYTKHLFTNYDADLNGVSHYDNAPTGYLGWAPRDTYFPFSSLELERGKPIAEYQYSGANTLLQQTIYTYRNDAGRFNNSLNVIQVSAHGSCGTCTVILLMVTGRSVYTYSYYPINKTITTWDQLGNNPVVQNTSYSYNSNNLVQTKTEIGSMGEAITHTYQYPTNFNDATSTAMTAANIISPVIEETINNNGLQINDTYTPYYTASPGIYVPLNTQLQIANNTREIREQANQYDLHGHIQEVQKVNDIKEVYLWGYNSQFIVAKITNSSYSTVLAAMNANGISQSQLDQAVFLTPAQMQSLLNPLRTSLTGALVTTYSYAPGIGITSETDPNNRTTTYEYDFLGRLFNIRDQDKNVIKKFCYNYAGQPQTCNIVGNAINTQSYTKSCPPYYSGNTLTYTVPANTYYAYTLAAANQQAAADQAANGQNYVNNSPSGTCTAWPGLPVSLATGGAHPTRIVTVSFYQGSTLVSTQTFSNSNGTIYAPAGTYTSLVVSQVNNISRTVYLSTWGAKTGITVTFNNVVMPGGYLTVN